MKQKKCTTDEFQFVFFFQHVAITTKQTLPIDKCKLKLRSLYTTKHHITIIRIEMFYHIFIPIILPYFLTPAAVSCLSRIAVKSCMVFSRNFMSSNKQHPVLLPLFLSLFSNSSALFVLVLSEPLECRCSLLFELFAFS